MLKHVPPFMYHDSSCNGLTMTYTRDAQYDIARQSRDTRVATRPHAAHPVRQRRNCSARHLAACTPVAQQCSACGVPVVEVARPATQGHHRPSPRRSTIDGRPPRTPSIETTQRGTALASRGLAWRRRQLRSREHNGEVNGRMECGRSGSPDSATAAAVNATAPAGASVALVALPSLPL